MMTLNWDGWWYMIPLIVALGLLFWGLAPFCYWLESKLAGRRRRRR